MAKPVILVPTDFTPVGESAVNYAQQLAAILQAKVTVMHVVAMDKEVAKATAAVSAISTSINNAQVESNHLVAVGNIFDDIGSVAKSIDARLIVMGTHGVKGMQHIMGSKALKVITNSDVPFIVVQKKPLKPEGFKKIVIPLNFQQEVKQSIKYAWEIGKYFNAKIHIVYLKEKDPFIAAKIERNIPYAEDLLQENGVSYEITGIDKSNFAKDLCSFSDKVQADLITIINNHENIFTYFGGSFEQAVIGNEQEIPVLVINAIQLKTAYSFSIYFG
ncbi:MAG: universal stress protein [Bacteroidetes bacterium]|nr:universal stress protein [Bacteroidota bacterium]